MKKKVTKINEEREVKTEEREGKRQEVEVRNEMGGQTWVNLASGGHTA